MDTLRGDTILAEIAYAKMELKKRKKKFISWEIRINDMDRYQLVIIHNDGFYTVAL